MQRHTFFLFLLMTFAPATLLAQELTTGDTREAKIDKLYEIGQFGDRFEHSTVMIQDLVVQLTEGDNVRPIIHVISEAFDGELLDAWAKESIRRNFRDDFADEVIDFYHSTEFSTLLKLMYANPMNIDDPEVQADLEQYIINIENNPETEARYLEISHIINKTRIIPILVQMMEDILTTVIFGLNVTLDEAERLTDRQLNDLVITMRMSFRELFNNVVPYTMAYSARELELDTLNQISEFLATRSGEWFIRTSNTATLDSFGEFARHASEAIAEWAITTSEAEEP